MDANLQARVEDLTRKFESNKIAWLYRNALIDSIIQNGPQCGIVALCMALKHLNVQCTVAELMEHGKRLNFTKSGEIFNNEYLIELAKIYYLNCELVDVKETYVSDLVKFLLNSKLILISYDCDFNFEPCFKKGVKAHWALVTGFLLPVELNCLNSILNTENSTKLTNLNDTDFKTTELVDIYEKEYQDKMLEFFDNKSVDELVHVFCRQGKSKSYGVWNFRRLIESNKQLKEIDSKRTDDEFYVKPADGNLENTLASKILVLY